MRIKNLKIVLVVLALLIAAPAALIAQTNVDTLRSDVDSRLRDDKTRVVVEKTDGTKVKGRITQTVNDSFTLNDSKTNQTLTIAFGDTKKIKGTGWSTGKKIGIIAAIGGGVTVLILGLAFQHAIRNN